MLIKSKLVNIKGAATIAFPGWYGGVRPGVVGAPLAIRVDSSRPTWHSSDKGLATGLSTSARVVSFTGTELSDWKQLYCCNVCALMKIHTQPLTRVIVIIIEWGQSWLPPPPPPQ